MNFAEGDYVPFDLAKVGKYTELLRESSRIAVLQVLGEAVVASPSLCISAWLYYQIRLGQADPARVRALLSLDAVRSQFRSGYDITLSENLASNSAADALYAQAVHLIRKSWPEMADLIAFLDPRVSLPPESETYESASDPLRFGQIYFNQKKATAIDWARVLVHEIAHHYLFILTAEWEAQGRRFPWDTSVYSSIKQTRRPLIGLLHGAYAQACMLELASRIDRKLAEYDKSTADGVDWIFARYAAGYRQDKVTLREFDLIRVASELETAFERPVSREVP